MASTSVTARTYPKRKRAEISYHESSSDESGVDDDFELSDEEPTMTARKKLKTGRTTVSEKPLPKRKIFPFMKLPAELRNQIYALALTDVNGIYLASKTRRYRRTVQLTAPKLDRMYSHLWKAGFNTLPALVPDILLLNKTIYAETQPILYAGNAFTVDDASAMHAFLATIGPKNRATIKDLTINGWGYSRTHKTLNFPAFTLLVGAVNLTRLSLDCVISWGGPDRKAKQLYRDGFHWLEAVGVKKGKFDAAVDMIEVTGDFFLRALKSGSEQEEMKKEFKAELRKLLS